MKGAWTPPSPHLASTCQEGEFCCLRCVQGCRGCCGLAPLQPQTTDQQVASALWTTHLCAETGHTPGPTRLDPVSRPLSCLGRRDGRMAQFTELPQSSGFLCAGSVPHRPAQRHTRLSPHSAPTASSYKRTWLHASWCAAKSGTPHHWAPACLALTPAHTGGLDRFSAGCPFRSRSPCKVTLWHACPCPAAAAGTGVQVAAVLPLLPGLCATNGGRPQGHPVGSLPGSGLCRVGRLPFYSLGNSWLR